MVKYSTHSSEFPYLYAFKPGVTVLPSKFSMLVVLGYAAALTVIEGKILPSYEFIMN